MLSYRHAFHAGNHADVLKHLTLKLVLDYFNQKDKPYWYIDTHAGAGLYNLHDAFAKQTGEYTQGIARLQNTPNLPPDLSSFVALINRFQMQAHLYPGSPMIAEQLLGPMERLKLFELHPTDIEHLRTNFQQHKRRCQVEMQDGFKGLISLLPPQTKRAVVLIDPPYEDKQDYKTVVNTLTEAYKRFQTGCYILWYPVLNRDDSARLPKRLKSRFPQRFVNAELHVHEPHPDGFGMQGSGIFVINPPYLLKTQLAQLLPQLTQILAQDDTAHYELTSHDQ